jgi:hypothetical protein
MNRHRIYKETQSQRKKQLKGLFLYLIGFLLVSDNATAQEVPVPESLKTYPSARCYWSYGVERLNSNKDSVHNYVIRVALQQQDSIGNNKGRLKLRGAIIYCEFSDNDGPKKIYFKRKGLNWIANFKVRTNQLLPLRIVANYRHDQRIMPLTLNEVTYPGEPDS